MYTLIDFKKNDKFPKTNDQLIVDGHTESHQETKFGRTCGLWLDTLGLERACGVATGLASEYPCRILATCATLSKETGVVDVVGRSFFTSFASTATTPVKEPMLAFKSSSCSATLLIFEVLELERLDDISDVPSLLPGGAKSANSSRPDGEASGDPGLGSSRHSALVGHTV